MLVARRSRLVASLVAIAVLVPSWWASAQEPLDPPPPAPSPSAATPEPPPPSPPASASVPDPPAASSAPLSPAPSSSPPFVAPPPPPPSASAPRRAPPSATTPPPGAPPPATKPREEPPPPPPREEAPREPKNTERGWEWLWLSAEGGVQHLSLSTLRSKGTLTPGIDKSAVTGPFGGLSAGVRLFILTVGLRGRVARFSEYMYWSLDPEVAIRFGTQGFQPYLLFGAGYSALGSLDSGSIASQAGASIRGFNVRAGLGVDVYVTHTISLGVLGTGEVVAMTRPGTTRSDFQVSGVGNINTNDPTQAQADLEAKRAEAEAKAAKVDGSGVGLAGSLSLVLGLHF